MRNHIIEQEQLQKYKEKSKETPKKKAWDIISLQPYRRNISEDYSLHKLSISEKSVWINNIVTVQIFRIRSQQNCQHFYFKMHREVRMRQKSNVFQIQSQMCKNTHLIFKNVAL